MQADVQSQVSQITQLLQEHFWRRWEFWIPFAELAVAAVGLLFAILAFREARLAKQAATAAGRTVRIQSVAIELTEISQRLERIQPDIKFSDARDLLAEISRRLLRATAPFVEDRALSTAVAATRDSLQVAHTSLTKVRPTDPTKEEEAPRAVYYAIEDNFATISNCVAHLIGLFERETFDSGDRDARS
jgi:hypothetical protein